MVEKYDVEKRVEYLRNTVKKLREETFKEFPNIIEDEIDFLTEMLNTELKFYFNDFIKESRRVQMESDEKNEIKINLKLNTEEIKKEIKEIAMEYRKILEKEI